VARFLGRPLDAAFYERLGRTQVEGEEHRVYLEGAAIDVDAGSLLLLELCEDAQTVDLFAFNRDDPYERIWHQSLVSESVFLTPPARLWGTLPRYRPLLSLVSASLTDRHHVVLGGTESAGRLATLMESRHVPRHLLTQTVSLFRRSRIDPERQALEALPSHAQAGDTVTFFAELDLCVLAVPRRGELRLVVSRPTADPLGWPFDPQPERREASAGPMVPGGAGHGFRVEAGGTFTITLVDGPQIVDVCLLNAGDPTEYYATGSQLAIEGGRIEKGTRLWSQRRPLATCVMDTVGERVHDPLLANHICHSDCCSGPFWRAVTGTARRSCYDNICDGLAAVGLDERAYHGNVNLFMSAAFDPATGDLVEGTSTATRGDRIAFRAEIPLHVALSVCPAGPGGPPGERGATTPVSIEVEVEVEL
jgi:uncharacterized protein YcgI (DUF1989 family)